MSAAEGFVGAWWALVSALTRMDGSEIALNVALSLGAVLAAFGLAIIAKRLCRAAIHRLPGPASAEKQVRATRVGRLLIRMVRVTLAAGALLVIGGIWGLDVVSWLTQGRTGVIAALLLRLAIVVAVAAAAYEFSGFVISTSIDRLAAQATERRRRAQLKTLGPLLRGLAQAVIVVVLAMVILSELGVKIGPLLAGAGVVGIAVGFGAQSIVRDLLTGIFLIVEDMVSVGDIVRIGDSSGLVERMTLRTIQLRDFDGTLHVIPYGEAQVVHNLTKTFSYYVFDLQVSYGSDIDGALQIMRETGAQMQQDPAFADKILDPIEVVGVDSLGDSGVVLKARIKTRPLEQWVVGREYNRRIKQAFDKAGIEIPFPHMKVVLPDDQLAEAPRH